MKRARKMLAILVAMAMTLGMTATAFASNATQVNGKEGDKAEIQVSGIEDANVTVTAYQIVKALYNNNGSFSGYESLYKGQISVSNDGVANSEFDRAALSEILTMINGDSEIEGIPMKQTSENSGTYTATVAPGSYLIVVKNGNRIYNPMVSSLYYENVAGQNVLTAQNAEAKSTDSPKIDKKVVSGNDKVVGNTLNIGQDVPYEVTIHPIPYYGGEHPQLKVTDILSDGLSFNGGSLNVEVISGNDEAIPLTENTHYSLDTKNGIVVDFVVGGKYTLNQYAGSTVVITYSAKLTDKADVNQTANTNSVKLEFTRDSNTESNGDSTSGNTYTYTFDITGSMNGIFEEGIIKKTGSETTTTTKGLEGAEFTLYTNADCTDVYTNTIMDDGKATSDKDGFLLIKGLAAGNYWLKETKAPDGYSLNDRAIPVIITADINPDNGQLKSFDIIVDGQRNTFTITEGVVNRSGVGTVEIKNTKLSSLPSTGGIGTTIFTIGGCIIMIVAAGLFFASRRKTAK